MNAPGRPRDPSPPAAADGRPPRRRPLVRFLGRSQRSPRPQRLLAVASGGGHWAQLMRMVPAFEGCDVTYLTVDRSYAVDVPGARLWTVQDSNRDDPLGLVRTGLGVALAVVRCRPDAVFSTGAAPGYFAVVLGKLLGARTVWLDSVANAEQLSLSGAKVGPYADLWLTQWPEVASPSGPSFHGRVL